MYYTAIQKFGIRIFLKDLITNKSRFFIYFH